MLLQRVIGVEVAPGGALRECEEVLYEWILLTLLQIGKLGMLRIRIEREW